MLCSAGNADISVPPIGYAPTGQTNKAMRGKWVLQRPVMSLEKSAKKVPVLVRRLGAAGRKCSMVSIGLWAQPSLSNDMMIDDALKRIHQ